MAATFIPPQLATRASKPPNGTGWVHEIKHDGYRMLALIDSKGVRFYSRNRLEWTDRFRDLAGAVGKLDARDGISDPASPRLRNAEKRCEHARSRTARQGGAENPDADGLLLLLGVGPRISWRSVQSVVTKLVPVENWAGAYDVVPVPAADLRQKLLAMTKDDGPADAAARRLSEIDSVRDEYGRPETEPRHPDIESGKPWPIMRPDPDDNAD